MLHVVLLELLVPQRQRSVVQEVVRKIIAYVSKDTSAEDRRSRVPVIGKQSVGELPEGKGENKEESGRHD